MNARSLQDTEAKVLLKEAELQAQGYRIVSKSDPKDLVPGEYIKNPFTGSSSSFDGSGGTVLTLCPLQ